MGFFSNLTGGDSRRDIKKSKAKAEGHLTEGFEGANERYDEAFDLFTPYAESGQQANERYNQLLGLGTPEERDAAQQTYLDDKAFQGMLGLESNRLLKQLNARGQTYGGTAALAGARVGLEGYGSYLNRLQGQGSQGFQATGAQAGIRSGQGDARYNFGATLAGNEISAGNAIASTRSTGLNNLLGVVGTAGKAAAAFSDVRLKRNINRVGTMASGIPIVEFEYVWGPEKHIGVIAQDALGYAPWAVVVDESGYLKVHYDMLI